jgi:hypothetical protein
VTRIVLNGGGWCTAFVHFLCAPLWVFQSNDVDKKGSLRYYPFKEQTIMDGIFSLPYSELSVIESLSKHLKKNKGFSMFVPVSRQQKDIDFLILNTRNAKAVTFQVKSSRVYPAKEKNKYGFEYYMWLNNFESKY